MLLKDQSPPVREGVQPGPAEVQASEAGEKPGSNWLGALLIFLLASCCLLPVFLVSLGAWLSTVSLGLSVPRWVALVGVSVAGLGVAWWWSRRNQACAPGTRGGGEPK